MTETELKRKRANRALWKLGAAGATLVMCIILMVCLVMDKATEAELTVIAYAREHNISALQYPAEVIALLEENPETKDFVLNYPFREEDPEIDLSTYDRSQGVPLFLQWDQRWGYLEYGDSLVAANGSGPMCLAMAGYYVTGKATFDPDRVVKFAQANEFYTFSGGATERLITVGAPTLDLKVTGIATVENKVAVYLEGGYPIIALMGPGDFTDDSHFIVLTGYQNGKLTVNDPNSLLNTGREWTFEELSKQIEKLWVIQAE